jgi:DNA-binding transcriptional MerR regulator
MAAMRIGEVATEAKVPTKTIRFWEAEGLLPEPARTPAGYRDYEAGIVDRLVFIRQAQASGLRLDEIRQILDISDAGDRPCRHVRDLLAARLAEVDARIAELTRARRVLDELGRRAAAQDPADCRGYCSILTS